MQRRILLLGFHGAACTRPNRLIPIVSYVLTLFKGLHGAACSRPDQLVPTVSDVLTLFQWFHKAGGKPSRMVPTLKDASPPPVVRPLLNLDDVAGGQG